MSDGKAESKPAWVAQLEAQPCECVSCESCNGSGSIWFDIGGRYRGKNRCDDLDEMEFCDSCGGSGTIEVCDRCAQLMDYEEDTRY